MTTSVTHLLFWIVGSEHQKQKHVNGGLDGAKAGKIVFLHFWICVLFLGVYLLNVVLQIFCDMFTGLEFREL